MSKSLSFKQKFLYSSTSAGVNLIFTTVSTWLLYFWAPPLDLARPHYLDVTLIGVLLTAGRIWDALIAPAIGHWSDTIHTPWGRRRPFLIFATPVMSISLVLLWTPPAPSSGAVNAIYFLVVSIAFYTSFHLIGIPYDSSLPEMASTAPERVSLSMWKNLFGTFGVLIGALLVAPLFSSVGGLGMGLVVAGLGRALHFAHINRLTRISGTLHPPDDLEGKHPRHTPQRAVFAPVFVEFIGANCLRDPARQSPVLCHPRRRATGNRRKFISRGGGDNDDGECAAVELAIASLLAATVIDGRDLGLGGDDLTKFCDRDVSWYR